MTPLTPAVVTALAQQAAESPAHLDPQVVPIEASWTVSLDCECPGCKKDVDVLTYPDFWDGRGGPKPFQIGEHGTDRANHLEVVCPQCGHEFEVTCVW